jgi:hypothetical protein
VGLSVSTPYSPGQWCPQPCPRRVAGGGLWVSISSWEAQVGVKGREPLVGTCAVSPAWKGHRPR